MEPYVGEIRCFSFGKIPEGWLPCDGRALQISQNAALYSLLSTHFGGNGQTTFCLPDLRGKVPMQYNPTSRIDVGTSGGTESVALTAAQMPYHTHQVTTNNAPGTETNPTGTYLAAVDSPHLAFNTGSSLVATAVDNTGNTGGNAAHPNMQPSLVLNFCIAIMGYYPPRP